MNEQIKDVFLSHASPDKNSYVRPFTQELSKAGISYWLDEAEIKWGDRITRKINDGLKKSRYVIVFLSDAFLGRNWTEAELESALNKENSHGQTVVLPLLLGNPDTIIAHYPLLRDKLYLEWNEGPASIVANLLDLLSEGREDIPLKTQINSTASEIEGEKPTSSTNVNEEQDEEQNENTSVINPSSESSSISEIQPIEETTYLERIQLLNAEIERDINNAELHAEMGDILFNQEHWTEAVKSYLTAISLKSDAASWHHKSAIALSHTGNPEEAEIAFFHAVKLEPQNTTFRYDFAVFLSDTAKWGQAVSQLETILQSDSKNKNAKEKLEFAQLQLVPELYLKAIELEESQPEEAKNYLQRIYAINPNYNDVTLRLAQLITNLNKKPSINPNNISDEAEKHAYLCRQHLERKNPEAAEKEIKQALEINVDNQLYHALLGRVYHAQERWTDAEASFLRALEIGPKTAVRYFELGSTAFAQQRWEKAEKYFRTASELDPHTLNYELNVFKARGKRPIIKLFRFLKVFKIMSFVSAHLIKVLTILGILLILLIVYLWAYKT